MGDSETIFRCDGCGAEFRVVSAQRPRVVCQDCKVVATPSGDNEALGAYRIGYARYQEARRQIGAGLKQYAGAQLVDARAMFNGASEDFEVAVKKFRKATKKADTEEIRASADSAREKTNCFWQGADWLSGATYAQEEDAAQRATHFREEAEDQLQRAREFGTVEPPQSLEQHTDAELPTQTDKQQVPTHGDRSGEAQSGPTPESRNAD